MKSVFVKISAVVTALIGTPAFAHSDHGSVVGGFVHFMTEPDHLAFSALVAVAVIFAVRKIATKRS